MNREEFEQRLAEALGQELTGDDRADFEAALAEHPDWKREYDEARRTLEALGSLSAPNHVEARREGDALIIEPSMPSRGARVPRPIGGAWRYAAAILVAFTAGYAVHASLVMRQATRPQESMVQRPTTPAGHDRDIDDEPARATSTRSLEAALFNVHARKPSSSTLAKCMIAVAARP